MKYLITGKGVVGKYLVKNLLESCTSNDQIVSISRQHRFFYDDHPNRNSALLLECYADLRLDPTRLISQYKPDVIIHAAGEGRQNAPSRDIWRANVDTTLNLLEACKCLGEPIKFLYCSSIVTVNGVRNVYRASKEAGESLVNTYMSEKLHTAYVRFPAVAGAGNKHGVVRDIVSKLLDKENNTLWLLNNSRKPLVYAGQLAREIIELTRQSYFHSIQLCSNDSITVQSIAQQAMDISRIKKNIEWTQDDIKGERVSTIKSDIRMHSCEIAANLAIEDILREDYGYWK